MKAKKAKKARRQLVVAKRRWNKLWQLARWIESVPPFVEVCDASWEGIEEWTNENLPRLGTEYCVSLETRGQHLIAVLATDPEGDEIRYRVVPRG